MEMNPVATNEKKIDKNEADSKGLRIPLPNSLSFKREASIKKPKRPFFTSSQLSDLFSRLDRNGDGELDLDEFTGIIRMLKLDVTEDFISKVFRAVDTNASGAIEMQEFICAYQKIYCKHHETSSGEEEKHADEFVRVTRYGEEADGKKVFELYTLSNDPMCGHNKKTVFNFEPAKIDHFHNYVTEDFNGNFEDLNKLICADNTRNSETGNRLMWWVDITMENVERSKVSKFVDIFGFPNNSKFLSSFGSFGTPLPPKENKSRIYVGSGVTVEGNVTSYSCFDQAITLMDVPVVNHLPSWLENKLIGSRNSVNPFGMLADYYTSRFAFMFNLSMLSDSRENESAATFESAAGMVLRFHDESNDGISGIEDDDEEDHSDGKENETAWLNEELRNNLTRSHSKFFGSHTARHLEGHTILKSGGKALPLRTTIKNSSPATWTLSNTELAKKKPVLKYNTFSMHVLENQSKGANCLVTIRELDEEASRFPSMEAKSRSGVLGRVFDGVWMKLLHVVGGESAVDVGGELNDCPATLMTFISALIHSYSMRSLGAIDSWLARIEEEVTDMVVSKHSAHVKHLQRVIKDCVNYVEPIYALHTDFLSDWEKESAQAVEAAARAFQMGEEQKSQFLKRINSSLAETVLSETDVGDSSGHNPLHKGTTAVHFTSTNIEHLPLSYDLIKRFYSSSVHRDLKIVTEGYDFLDMKGLHYWKERLSGYSTRLEDIKDLIGTQLDEKRNFTSFTLTIVTTLLAPLAILTGYFGMNFDNMKELDSTTYTAAPGIYLMWYVTAIAYGVMLLGAIHFRIIYSAT